MQENSTQHGGKRPGQTAFEVVNTGSVTQIGNSYFQAGQGAGNLVINTLGGANKNMV